MEFSFIIIDDSELDCFIAQRLLKHSNRNVIVKTFQDARQVLEIIGENSKEDNQATIILLDLQMPLMSGFDFVEEFEKFPAEVQKSYTIAILSSTKNPTDVYKILTYKTVNSIIEKPLTKEKLLSLISRV
jgi:CheY-like chemotaxis protein